VVDLATRSTDVLAFARVTKRVLARRRDVEESVRAGAEKKKDLRWDAERVLARCDYALLIG